MKWYNREVVELDSRIELQPKGVCAASNGLVWVPNGQNLLALICLSGYPVNIPGLGTYDTVKRLQTGENTILYALLSLLKRFILMTLMCI